MRVPHKTPHLALRWLSIAFVARAIGISTQTARRLVRSGTIPGGALMYRFDNRKGERWHVEREVFDRWQGRAAA